MIRLLLNVLSLDSWRNLNHNFIFLFPSPSLSPSECFFQGHEVIWHLTAAELQWNICFFLICFMSSFFLLVLILYRSIWHFLFNSILPLKYQIICQRPYCLLTLIYLTSQREMSWQLTEPLPAMRGREIKDEEERTWQIEPNFRCTLQKEVEKTAWVCESLCTSWHQ